MPASRSAATVAPASRFASFLPSGPRTSPWWTYSGAGVPSASCSRRWSRSFTVIGATNDVRDREVAVVDDAREVIGRGAVRAEALDPLEAIGADLRSSLAI